MTFWKAVIIGCSKGLVEATVYNRSEVVKYLERNNWHLDRENFVCVAPDEYCLVNKSALTPDMDIVDEEIVHTWSTAETVELRELRMCKARFIATCRMIQIEIVVICIAAIVGTLTMWKSSGLAEAWLFAVVCIAAVCIHLCAFKLVAGTEV